MACRSIVDYYGVFIYRVDHDFVVQCKLSLIRCRSTNQCYALYPFENVNITPCMQMWMKMAKSCRLSCENNDLNSPLANQSIAYNIVHSKTNSTLILLFTYNNMLKRARPITCARSPLLCTVHSSGEARSLPPARTS